MAFLVEAVLFDLDKADETLKAFTKEAATFKIESFAETKPFDFKSTEAAYDELVGKMGYSQFLEATNKQLKKQWDVMHPDTTVVEEKKAEKKAAPKKAAPKKDAKK